MTFLLIQNHTLNCKLSIFTLFSMHSVTNIFNPSCAPIVSKALKLKWRTLETSCFHFTLRNIKTNVYTRVKIFYLKSRESERRRRAFDDCGCNVHLQLVSGYTPTRAEIRAPRLKSRPRDLLPVTQVLSCPARGACYYIKYDCI